MKNKFRLILGISLVGLFGVAAMIFAASAPSNDYTDFWTIKGKGTLSNTSIVFVDDGRDINLYDGDLVHGLNGSRPSITSYAGQQSPFYNASGATLTAGQLLISSAAATGGATTTTAVATTTVIGVCAGTVASGAVGWMYTGGYSVLNVTDVVKMGDLLTSTNTLGYAATGSSTNGTIIGKAMSTSAGGGASTVVAIINLQ